ncbi:MAG: hypothetical protein GX971_04835 [Firmicutes bacterium]|nr:hypothetical protein [Bacillota bacterium]
MKRNILLLTAVVLAAVMLAGCTLWPFGKVVLKVEVPKDDDGTPVAEITNLAKNGKYKREDTVKLNVKYTIDLGDDVIKWSADDKDVKIFPTEHGPTNEMEFGGQTLEIKLGKKDVKITGVLEESE